MTMTFAPQEPGAAIALTDEQRRIVEWGEGPAVVIAGAGTGKTRVIVERVRHLLATRGAAAGADDPLLPEHILVLTYNVKAAAELQARLEQTLGVTTAARLNVSNFHSFCQRILTEHAADAGLPPRPDVLDGVAQVLLLQDIRPQLELIYHSTVWWLGSFVQFINRCKDELVSPDDFDAFAAEERRVFEARYGDFEAARDRLALQGNLKPQRDVRKAYGGERVTERAEERGEEPAYTPGGTERAADLAARKAVQGDGQRVKSRKGFGEDDIARIDALAATYVIDGAALEVMRLTELARVYRAYETELHRRGALDFGEQIAAVSQLFRTRPNVLRHWQRLVRYLLVDEFQDANVAQIELIELLGRTPDRPDNVMVVGDDDQSIYRFRGASFAAFAEFETRFAKPPTHAPQSTPPGPPTRLRLEENFRSGGHVLTAANRLIATNATRFEPDKLLRTQRGPDEPVQVIVCAGPDDEADAIVELIKAHRSPGEGVGYPLSSFAVLYRKHKHRDAIVARLRDEDIPYTVVGGLSLFSTPEIRDLEQGLRAIADPHDDAALVRMLSGGPWRLDALEILTVTRMANFDRGHLLDAITRIVAEGTVEEDVVGEVTEDGKPAHATADAKATLRAKLRNLQSTLDELTPLVYREGPHTILERYLERTGQVLDLIAADTLESKRTVVNIASFLRFAADWQQANPNGTLAGFVAYLDAYQEAGGELPTSVELSEDVEGVRLMTLYQAKGLEFPIVIVPQLLEKEWPTQQGWGGLFPAELLREAVPPGDLHTEEERRLLYVAMTRAQHRLILTTHGGRSAKKRPSLFISEVTWGGGEDIRLADRTTGEAATPFRAGAGAPDDDDAFDDGTLGLLDIEVDDVVVADAPDAAAAAIAAARRVMPLPSARERRLALRLRASELVGLMESTPIDAPETAAARELLEAELTSVGRSAALRADEARAAGLDPLTLRTVALDSGAGANLLQVAPLPGTHSYSSLSMFEACPLKYAFGYVYRMPRPDRPVAPFTFGTTAHEAFEAFTKARREAVARGEAPPTREDLEAAFRARWVPAEFGDQVTEANYGRRVQTLLDNFWEGEVASLGEAIAEEREFELVLESPDDDEPVRIRGSIDRIDQLPGGGIEVIDYKTGSVSSQSSVDHSLQLSIYALACRDALGLGTPERVTLYFTESALRLSTTRTDEQLDAARADILARVAVMRSGAFAATPGKPCQWCDYRAMCPERV